jgi:acyl-ACP thioesterase
MVYTKTVTLQDNLTPGGVLTLLQAAAGDHSNLLGVGWDALQEKGLFWAVLRHRLEYARLPKKGETVTVKTWPMETTRSAYPRATEGYDEEGNLLFRGVSLWVLMDKESRAMVLPKRSGVTVEGENRGCEAPMPGSLSPMDLENPQTRVVTGLDLDENGHMNNCRYLDWAAELLPGECVPPEGAVWTICYLSEAREGEIVDITWELGEDQILSVDAHRKEKEVSMGHSRVFSVQIQF